MFSLMCIKVNAYSGEITVQMGLPPSCKGVCSKRKEFASFRAPSHKGCGVQKRKQEVTMLSHLYKMAGFFKCTHVFSP